MEYTDIATSKSAIFWWSPINYAVRRRISQLSESRQSPAALPSVPSAAKPQDCTRIAGKPELSRSSPNVGFSASSVEVSPNPLVRVGRQFVGRVRALLRECPPIDDKTDAKMRHPNLNVSPPAWQSRPSDKSSDAVIEVKANVGLSSVECQQSEMQKSSWQLFPQQRPE